RTIVLLHDGVEISQADLLLVSRDGELGALVLQPLLPFRAAELRELQRLDASTRKTDRFIDLSQLLVGSQQEDAAKTLADDSVRQVQQTAEAWRLTGAVVEKLCAIFDDDETQRTVVDALVLIVFVVTLVTFLENRHHRVR